jgi:hypothetical protein
VISRIFRINATLDRVLRLTLFNIFYKTIMDSGRRPVRATSAVIRSSLAYSEDRLRSYIYALSKSTDFTVSHHSLYLEIDLMKQSYPTTWLLTLKKLFLEIHGELIQTGTILDYCLDIQARNDEILNSDGYDICSKIEQVYRWVLEYRYITSYHDIRHAVSIAFIKTDSQQSVISRLYEKNYESLVKYCFLMGLIDSKQIYNNLLAYLNTILQGKSLSEILQVFHRNEKLLEVAQDGYLVHRFYRFIDKAINQEGAEGLTRYIDKWLREEKIPSMYVELYNLLEQKDRFEVIYKADALIRLASGISLDKELELYTGLRTATGGLSLTKSLFRDALSSKDLPIFKNLQVLLISNSSYSPLLQLYSDLPNTLEYTPSYIPDILAHSMTQFDTWFKENQHKKRYSWIYRLSKFIVEYDRTEIIVNFIQFMILYKLSRDISATYGEIK